MYGPMSLQRRVRKFKATKIGSLDTGLPLDEPHGRDRVYEPFVLPLVKDLLGSCKHGNDGLAAALPLYPFPNVV